MICSSLSGSYQLGYQYYDNSIVAVIFHALRGERLTLEHWTRVLLTRAFKTPNENNTMTFSILSFTDTLTLTTTTWQIFKEMSL